MQTVRRTPPSRHPRADCELEGWLPSVCVNGTAEVDKPNHYIIEYRPNFVPTQN